MVVMDQFTRRIIGFGIHRGILDGWHYEGRSNGRFERAVFLNTSAQIMIRYIASTGGIRVVKSLSRVVPDSQR